MKVSLLFFISAVTATHLSLNGGVVGRVSCGSECLTDLDCSQDAVDSFGQCITTKCGTDDLSVAGAIERFMSSCQSVASQNVNTQALSNLKALYISSQMAIMKRQVAAAANATASGNGTSNSSSNGTAGGTGTASSAASSPSCTSLAGVLDRSCIASTSGASQSLVSSTMLLLGSVSLAVLAI